MDFIFIVKVNAGIMKYIFEKDQYSHKDTGFIEDLFN